MTFVVSAKKEGLKIRENSIKRTAPDITFRGDPFVSRLRGSSGCIRTTINISRYLYLVCCFLLPKPGSGATTIARRRKESWRTKNPTPPHPCPGTTTGSKPFGRSIPVAEPAEDVQPCHNLFRGYTQWGVQRRNGHGVHAHAR